MNDASPASPASPAEPVTSPTQAPHLLAIYADESCLGNGQSGDTPGGAGGVIEWRHPITGAMKRWDYWISEPATTNNRMALRSVIEAFLGISRKKQSFNVTFISDSRYIVDGMTSWVHGWAARGWKRKGGPIENLDLWQEALRAINDHHCEWRWVRGHKGHPQNEYANHLATRAAADQSQSGGLVVSQFDEWYAAHSGKSVTTQQLAEFPTPESFKGKRYTWRF